MEATFAYAVWLLCVCSLGNVFPVDSSHFMGGIIRWKPVNPAAFDGTVQITHRVTLKHTTCNTITINTATLSVGQRIRCQSGCSGTIGASTLSCTDFGMHDGWSTGEQAFIYNFGVVQSYFELLFVGGNWISLFINESSRLDSADWEFRVRGSLTYREHTGLVNSPPVVNIPPLIQQGCSHTIKLPVGDADGDHVRCRWAESSLNECGDVCRHFLATLKDRQCEIEYNGSSLAPGDYAVALQVEDFSSPTDTISLSSVPVQFVVRIQEIPSSPCADQPQFVGPTPFDGVCISVPFSTSWNAMIIARVSDSATATSIREIVTTSPLGVRKSELFRSDYYPGGWQVNITWTPLESQFGGPNIFCFAALDSAGLQSDQRCVTLFIGAMSVVTVAEPPMIVPNSISPTGEILTNQGIWSVQFNKKFTRPTRDSFIRIFDQEEDEMFLSINVRTSSAVTYPGPSDTFDRTLTFKTNSCQLPFNQTFYVLFDAGVAVGTDLFCRAESPPLTDPTLWTFVLRDTPGQSNTVTVTNERDTPGQSNTVTVTNENILITTVCTVLAFIVGVISGLVTYHCVSALLKRKANLERQSQSGNLKRIHYKKNVNIEAEASDVYDKVIPRASRPGMPDVQLKLSDNVAYGQA